MGKTNVVPSGIRPRSDELNREILKTSAILCELFLRWSEAALDRMQTAEKEAIQRLEEYVPTEPLLTTKHAAAYLGFTERTLNDWTKPGKSAGIPYILIGGEKRFRKASLDRELERREIKRPEIRL